MIDINVIRIDKVTEEVSLGFGSQPRTCIGNRKVVQQFVMGMLTDKGSDFMRPGFGGGLSTMRINTYSAGEEGLQIFTADIVDRMRSVRDEIIASQPKATKLLASETLLRAELKKINLLSGEPKIAIHIDVITGDNSRKRIHLERS